MSLHCQNKTTGGACYTCTYIALDLTSKACAFPYLITGFVYTHNEDQLCNEETNTQVHMNVVSHTPERPVRGKDMELHHEHDYQLMNVLRT